MFWWHNYLDLVFLKYAKSHSNFIVLYRYVGIIEEYETLLDLPRCFGSSRTEHIKSLCIVTGIADVKDYISNNIT